MLIDQNANGNAAHVESIEKVLDFFLFNHLHATLADLLLVLHYTMRHLLDDGAMAIENRLETVGELGADVFILHVGLLIQ